MALTGLLRDDVTLAVHAVLAEVVHPHRLEGAGAHVQREPGAVRAVGLDAFEQSLVEMQAGRGRSDRAGVAREHGLVARLVGFAGGALDVGRQRQLAVALEQREQVFTLRKAQVKEFANATEHLDLEGIGKAQAAAGFGRLARAHLRERLVRTDRALDQHLDLAATVLDAMQPCVDDAGVVEYEQVARPDQVGERAEACVRERGRLARLRCQHQQTACAALGQRCLRDQLGGERVVEVTEREGHRDGVWLWGGMRFACRAIGCSEIMRVPCRDGGIGRRSGLKIRRP